MPCCTNGTGCCITYDQPNQCYYGWPFLGPQNGSAFVVSNEGKKFIIEYACIYCGEYEMVEPNAKPMDAA